MPRLVYAWKISRRPQKRYLLDVLSLTTLHNERYHMSVHVCYFCPSMCTASSFSLFLGFQCVPFFSPICNLLFYVAAQTNSCPLILFRVLSPIFCCFIQQSLVYPMPNKGSILPFQKMTTTTLARVCQNGVSRTIMSGVKGWEEMDLDTTLPGIVKIENERWHHQPMRPKSTTVPQPTNKKPRPKKAGQATGPTPPSKAEICSCSRVLAENWRRKAMR
jgi:hypothetical protein